MSSLSNDSFKGLQLALHHLPGGYFAAIAKGEEGRQGNILLRYPSMEICWLGSHGESKPPESSFTLSEVVNKLREKHLPGKTSFLQTNSLQFFKYEEYPCLPGKQLCWFFSFKAGRRLFPKPSCARGTFKRLCFVCHKNLLVAMTRGATIYQEGLMRGTWLTAKFKAG